MTALLRSSISATLHASVGVPRLLFVLPVAALDSTFAVWVQPLRSSTVSNEWLTSRLCLCCPQTFVELSHTVTALHARRQTAKLLLYSRFTRTMAIFVLVSVLWSSYEVYVVHIGPVAQIACGMKRRCLCRYIAGPNGNMFDERWSSYWMLEGFWPGLYFAILVGIMWLWAPSKNALRCAATSINRPCFVHFSQACDFRYAYSEELAIEDEDDYLDQENQQLLATGETKQSSTRK